MYLKAWQTWLFIAYILLVMYFSLTPTLEFSWFLKLWKYDKIIHFSEYLGVGFLMINMLMIKPLKKMHWQFALIFLIIFPMCDEYLQYYSPNRIPDIYDVISDIFGGIIGAYLRKIL